MIRDFRGREITSTKPAFVDKLLPPVTSVADNGVGSLNLEGKRTLVWGREVIAGVSLDFVEHQLLQETRGLVGEHTPVLLTFAWTSRKDYVHLLRSFSREVGRLLKVESHGECYTPGQSSEL